VEAARARELLAGARVGRFGTRAADGPPRIVPVCFAVDGDVVYHAVDHKPKATRRLARLADLAADPRATLLVDHYDDVDWDALWWVRAEGSARVLDDVTATEAARALGLLAERYAQYRRHRPAGPVVALDVERLVGWEAAVH
jgi:PPOX class probable F420-dependent enzyme